MSRNTEAHIIWRERWWGDGAGAFLTGAGFSLSSSGVFLIDLLNDFFNCLPISEIACSGPLNLTQFEETGRTSATNLFAV